MSLVGNDLQLRQVGVTAFGNKVRALDVTKWNINQSIENAAGAALQAAGRNVAKTPDAAAGTIGGWSYTNFTSSYTFGGGAAGLRNVALTAKADYLILVTDMPQGFGDPFFRTNQSVTGFGVYQRRGFGAVNYADFGLLLVDGRSGETIDRRRAFHSTTRSGDMWIDIENGQPGVADLGQSQADFVALIEAAAKRGLGYLGLIQRS